MGSHTVDGWPGVLPRFRTSLDESLKAVFVHAATTWLSSESSMSSLGERRDMSKNRKTAQEIINKLGEAEVLQAKWQSSRFGLTPGFLLSPIPSDELDQARE